MKDLVIIKKKIEDNKRIISWLDSMGVQNYRINSDLTVDVDGDVLLGYKKLETIPIQFGKVTGCFDLLHNDLTSLKGCPIHVGATFRIDRNKIKTLEYCPKYIGGSFYVDHNPLDTLLFACRNTNDSGYPCHGAYLPHIVRKDKRFKIFGEFITGHLISLEIMQDPRDILTKFKSHDRSLWTFMLLESPHLRQRMGLTYIRILTDYLLYKAKSYLNCKFNFGFSL